MNAILNNQKRFDNLYDTNKNVVMLNSTKNTYILFFYGRLVTVLFSVNGWSIINE